jgi:hypothetical protein
MLLSEAGMCVCVCVCVCVLRVGPIRGVACVNIGFRDDGTPGVPKHIIRKRCVDCAI